MVGDARNRGNTKYLGSTHHVFYFVEAHRTVLAVDHHKIVADGAEQLHLVWRITADDGAEHNLALGQFGLCSIRPHSALVTSKKGDSAVGVNSLTGDKPAV